MVPLTNHWIGISVPALEGEFPEKSDDLQNFVRVADFDHVETGHDHRLAVIDSPVIAAEVILKLRLVRDSGERPAINRLHDGCLAWLREVQQPDVAAILFDVGPSALGVERARAIEDRHGMAVIGELLNAAAAEQALDANDVPIAAAFVNALVGAAAIHRARHGSDVSAALSKALDGMLTGLGTS